MGVNFRKFIMIYIQEIRREEKDTLFTFLKRCIKKKGFKDEGRFPRTYKNEECTDDMFESGMKYRSLEAIIEISKTYFRVSEKQVAKTLKKIIEENYSYGFLYCGAANKWIFYHASYSIQLLDRNVNFTLTYGKTQDKLNSTGCGKYTYNQIHELMNS